MKIHEYQAKSLLNANNINVPVGYVADNLQKVNDVLEKIGTPCLVKAQVHSGGRGKAGGVKFAKDKTEALEFAKNILGSTLTTIQNAPSGQPVNYLLLEKPSSIDSELYFGMLIDRDCNKVCMIMSTAGGMDIEEIAEKYPDKILKQWIDISIGLKPHHILAFQQNLKIDKRLRDEFHNCLNNFYSIFTQTDLSLLEINPLAITKDNAKIIALDAKMVFDDNALYRLPNIRSFHDPAQEDKNELEAQKFDLNFITLDGNIGCLVNGAGLAMSTMDIIKHVGGAPANFLDVGGGATIENVQAALQIILKGQTAKSVLINIFGGIVKCDVIASGIIAAAKNVNITIPLVVRLEGTNAEKGREIILEMMKSNTLNIHLATSLLDAATKAVNCIEHN